MNTSWHTWIKKKKKKDQTLHTSCYCFSCSYFSLTFPPTLARIHDKHTLSCLNRFLNSAIKLQSQKIKFIQDWFNSSQMLVLNHLGSFTIKQTCSPAACILEWRLRLNTSLFFTFCKSGVRPTPVVACNASFPICIAF